MDHDFERVADLQLFGLDGERELPEGKRPLGFAADVDEQFILILGDDDAGQDLPFVENLEALFVEALFERELVFFFDDRRFRRERGSDKWLLPYNILFFIFGSAGTTKCRVARAPCGRLRFRSAGTVRRDGRKRRVHFEIPL